MNMSGMVIIGGGMAGARACISLRASGYEGKITLICAETLLPYDRPPLSKAMMVSEEEPTPAFLLDDGIAKSLNVTLVQGDAAASVDRTGHKVLTAKGHAIAYNKLLIATGAQPRRLTLPGAERALTLRDFVDTQKLRKAFAAKPATAIIGGGFIGLELASSAAKLGCKVTLIEAQPRILMRGVPAEIAAVVHQRHVEAGVDMQTGTGLAALDNTGVTLADGRKIHADVIIAGVGAVPEIRLAEAAGLAIENGIAVNGELQTSDPDIYAAGDCCSFPHPLFNGRRLRLEAWRNAQDQGNLAAENMLGGSRTYGAVPWFWSDQYELSLQIAGLPDEGATTVRRSLDDKTFIMFYLAADGRLVAACGIGVGNAIARDIKLAEMLIAKRASPSPQVLADAGQQLRALLKG